MGTSPSTGPNVPFPHTRIVRRVLALLALAVVALVGGSGAWLYWRTHICLPQLEGTIALPGLSGRVEVLRDSHGVPHLRAQSLEDLFFAQGYVTAQDRLWQMDLSRRVALGELSEIFGERALRFDIENRTLGFRRVCERAVVDTDTEVRKLFSAYARGVNAFISTHLERLPIEFMLLDYQPRLWQEADSLAIALNMAKTLNTTWPDELMRERIRAKVNPQLYADLFPDRSPLDHPVAEPVSGSPDIAPLAAFQRASPSAPEIAAPHPSISQYVEHGIADSVLAALAGEETSPPAALGSNNWVVSGAHTQSGLPLLANDPHLGHSVPSVWYMIHLKAPGLNATGVSLPGLPAVIIGHNERIAWGMTNTGPDVQDLYAESFNFREPDRYLHGNEWVKAEVREEVIKVREARDHKFTVKATRHGPVISQDGNRDLALRWTALEPGALQFPFFGINQAQNWDEFTSALRHFSGPMQNIVYADVDGNIGYYAAGWIPIRAQEDGSVPSPGSTDAYDWTGYVPFESLPRAYNPPSGIIATANGRVVPDDYPYRVTEKWEAPYRTARVYELLEGGAKFAIADMLRIQNDIHTMEDKWLAGELLAAAAKHAPENPEARYALSLLEKWDGEARANSAATLVCEVTQRALLERIVAPKLGPDLSGYYWPMSAVFLQNVFERQWSRWLPPDDADFAMTLMKSLEAGVGRIPAIVGSADRNAWRWGDTIQLTFRHPLSSAAPLLGYVLDLGPVPQSGTGTTVKQTTRTLGPSMRMVVDLANLDNSVQNITLGESGQVFSPYYKDQFEAWYNGRSFPMSFSDAAAEKDIVHRLVLAPAGQP